MTATRSDRIRRSFRRGLTTYADQAGPQRVIATLLARRLYRAGAPVHWGRVFEFGAGTGNLTDALRGHFDISYLAINDLVAETSDLITKSGAQFLPGDIERIDWPARLDLIASSSTLQWVAQPQDLLARLADHLAPKGWMAISGFGPAQFQELTALGSQAAAPGYLSALQMKQAVAAQVQVVDAGDRKCRLWFDHPRDVLAHLRQTGVNGRASRTWTRRDLAQFCAAYQDQFGQNGRVPLTYHPIWVIAQKPG